MINDLISSYFENSFQIVKNTSYFKAQVSENITYMVWCHVNVIIKNNQEPKL